MKERRVRTTGAVVLREFLCFASSWKTSQARVRARTERY